MPLKIGRFDLVPVIVFLLVTRTVTEYYELVFPSLSEVINLFYLGVSGFSSALFPLMIVIVIQRPRRFTLVNPAIWLAGIIALKLISLVLITGSTDILKQEYYSIYASGTNDESGFYFGEISAWTRNLGVLLFLFYYVNSSQRLISCIIAAMVAFFIPGFLVAFARPELLGERESILDGLNFAGSVWNLGVRAFSSLAWLFIALYPRLSVTKKLIGSIVLFAFIFLGIASLSRTFIVLIVLGGVSYLYFARKSYLWIFSFSILMLVGVILAMVWGDSLIFDAFSGRFSEAQNGNIRLLIWASYLSNISDYFLFGAPEGSYYLYFSDSSFAPHSVLLNWLVQYGIFALGSFLIMLSAIWRKFHKASDEHLSLCLKIWVLTYAGLSFINQTGFSGNEFYVAFGILFATIKVFNNHHILHTTAEVS